MTEIYKRYQNKGFQIISISVDTKKNKIEWLRAIKKYNLNWLHYWDVDQKEASRISVNAYPTTFLLGADGKIISKNIEPEQLQEFLKKF